MNTIYTSLFVSSGFANASLEQSIENNVSSSRPSSGRIENLVSSSRPSSGRIENNVSSSRPFLGRIENNVSSSRPFSDRIENPHSLASIAKSKKILEYQPSHNLEKGLKEAVDWY